MLNLKLGKVRKRNKELEKTVNEVVSFVKENNVSVIHCFVQNNEEKDIFFTDIKVVYSDCEFKYFTPNVGCDNFEEASKDCKRIIELLSKKRLSERILDDSESIEYLY